MAMRRPGTGSSLILRSDPEGYEDGQQQEDKPLQEWLEDISQRMMKRIDVVGEEVQKLVQECGAVELDLKNTFNSFRCLSSTQFVENRVYEEDETESVRAETPAKESQHSLAPTESYEDEILPRYKDAVSTAWATFQEINHQHDQASRRLRSRNKVLRNLDYDGRLHLVPHIIGTDEFARDIHCGLAELRLKRSVVDGFEVDSDTEREGADLAAELIGAGSVSEGEWSEAESDPGDQGGGFEPAVSAALDFKAMLEAALRNPSLPYDGNASTQASDKYGEEVNKDYFISNAAIDNQYGSPRIISRTVESGDHRGRDTSAKTDASNSGGSWQVTGSHIPGEVAVQSADSVGVSSSLPAQASREEQPRRATIEELLKKPFILKTQNSTKENPQNSSGSNVQLDYSGLANIPFIPGGLFDDDEEDTVSISSDRRTVRDSSTDPTVPERLFQRKQSTGAVEHTNVESQSSSSVDLDLSESPALEPSSTTLRLSPKLNVTALFQNLESRGSMKLETSRPSSALENAENVVTRSETSNGLTGQVTSTSTLPTHIRGGLFDDSDDDEDAGDLFGKSLSIKVTDAGVNSQPILRTWTSISSKGLFDDLDDEADVQETLAPQSSGSSREERKSDELSSQLSQVSSSGRSVGHFPPGQSSWATSGSTSESFRKEISSSNLSGISLDRNQKQVPSSSPSGSTPSITGKIPTSSGLSESSSDPLQEQSPDYNLSRVTLNQTQQQLSGSYLSGSSSDDPKNQLFGSVVDSTPKQLSGSSLVGSVLERTDVVSSGVNIDSEVDGAKEMTSEPHVNLESLLAAGMRPTSRAVVYSSDDSDSWSSSGSDGDGHVSSQGKPDSVKGLRTSVKDLEANHEKDKLQEIDGTKPAGRAAVEDNKSTSVEGPSIVLVAEVMRITPSSYFGSQHVSSPSSLPRPGRSLSDTQVMEMPEEKKPLESLRSILGSIRPRLPPLEETAEPAARTSRNADVAAGAEKLIHTTLSRPLGPSKRRAPSPSHTLKSTQSLPVLAPPRQSQPFPRNVSQNDIPSDGGPSAPVMDIGGLTTGRTFTSLFDEDDGEDDLFGIDFPHKQIDLQFDSKLEEPESPFDLPTDVQNRKRDEGKGLRSPVKSKLPVDFIQTTERDEDEALKSSPKSKSPLDLFTTRGRDETKIVASPTKSKSPLDLNLDDESKRADEAKESPFPANKTRSPFNSRVPMPSAAKKSDIKVDDAELLPSGRSASKLSSLLFGDDDDDDSEDALFGPLREKSSRGSSDWLVSTSSPARRTSTRRTSGSSLFDD